MDKARFITQRDLLNRQEFTPVKISAETAKYSLCASTNGYFTLCPIPPQEIVSQLLTAGQISSDTFLRRLSALEVLPVGKTIDKEKLDINLDKTT